MWIKKLFSEENKLPRTLFDARKVAGSATYKQSSMKSCCSFTVSLYIKFTESKDKIYY